MKNFYLLFILILCSFITSSCSSDDNNGSVDASKLISAVTSKQNANNTLREDIEINFKSPTSYQIEYWPSGDEKSKQTTEQSEAKTSDKCTLIFLKAETEYSFRIIAQAGNQNTVSDTYKFTTGSLPSSLPSVYELDDKMTQELDGYIMVLDGNKNPSSLIITNTKGETVWYHIFNKVFTVATFDPKTHTIVCLTGNKPSAGVVAKRGIVVFDLFDKELANIETSLMVHNEVKLLPNGDILMVELVPKDYDLTVYGGSKNQTVYGEGLVVMGQDGKVKWQWDCFSEIDPRDDEHIMDVNNILNLHYYEDWLHANSAAMDEEGNYYITLFWTNQMWKIDGKTKKVIYKLGENGDFNLSSDDMSGGMHCVTALSKSKILLFDNGLKTHISRGLIYDIDETAKKATASTKLVMPSEYSSQFTGSITQVNDDMYMLCGSLSSTLVFMDTKGNMVRTLKTSNQPYRSQYIKDFDLYEKTSE